MSFDLQKSNNLLKRFSGFIWNLAYLSGFLAFLEYVKSKPDYRGLIFYYHGVSPYPGWDPFNLTLSPVIFRRQLRLAKKKFLFFPFQSLSIR